MTNPWSIGKCLNCDQEYCQECTEAKDWQSFCCKGCEAEYEDDDR